MIAKNCVIHGLKGGDHRQALLFREDRVGFMLYVFIPCNNDERARLPVSLTPEGRICVPGEGCRMFRWQQHVGPSWDHFEIAWFSICGKTFPVVLTVRGANDNMELSCPGKKVYISVGWPEHPIRVRMGTSCTMSSKGHHIKED